MAKSSVSTATFEQKLNQAQRLFKNIALQDEHGLRETRFLFASRYGENGPTNEQLEPLVEAMKVAPGANFNHLILLVKGIRGMENEPMVIVTHWKEFRNVVAGKDGLFIPSVGQSVPYAHIQGAARSGVVLYGVPGH